MEDFRKFSPNIVVEGVQVRYRSKTTNPNLSRRSIRDLGRKMLAREGTTTVRALRGINFVAHEGEMVGIVGANGSGKSTLLRNIAGVEQPDRGRILVRYQPLLLGVSAALQTALSGSENVRLGCLAMGLTPEEADEAFEYVVELSALGSAIYRPMGTYSSGMAARLRFAIALAARPKILLIDEALSTGDATFAERSEHAMDGMLESAGTVLLVNHAAKVIQELCTRAVWMHHGEVIMDGPAESVAEKYRWWSWNVAKGKEDTADQLLHDVVKQASKEEISILEPELISDPVPRHATRRTPNRRHRSKPRGAGPWSRAESENEIDLASAESTVWDSVHNTMPSKAQYPVLPKPASEVLPPKQKAYKNMPAPRLRPANHRVVLRAADPRDRASTVAAADDLTGRRIQAGRKRDTATTHQPRNPESPNDAYRQ